MKAVSCSLFLLCAMFLPAFVMAQGVGLNTTNNPAHPSSILDMDVNDRGVLIPRLTTAERDAINNPAYGLIVINKDNDCFNMYDGVQWRVSCFDCNVNAPTAGSNSPVCAGNAINLTASSISGATYSWTGPNGFSSSQQNPNISNATTLHSGTYTVIATLGTCNSASASVTVAVNTVDASFTWSPQNPAINQSVTYSAATGGATYSWTFSGGTPPNASTQSPAVTYANSGDYITSLTVSQNACQSSFTDTITVSLTACNMPGSSSTYAGPLDQYNFCWYLGKENLSCDQVCASVSGTNLANSAMNAWGDNCSSAQSNDISTMIYNNGNPAGWTSGTGGTSGKGFGYGYANNFGGRYGKCVSGSSDIGVFPGQTGVHSSRTLICPCFTSN